MNGTGGSPSGPWLSEDEKYLSAVKFAVKVQSFKSLDAGNRKARLVKRIRLNRSTAAIR